MSASSVKSFIQFGVCLLCWLSSVIDFGLFFPIGAFFVYQKSSIIRQNALSSIFVQILVYFFLVPMELGTYLYPEFESFLSEWLATNAFELKFSLLGFGLALLVLQNYFLKKKYQYQRLNRLTKKQYKRKYKIFSFLYLLFFLFLASILTDEVILNDSFEIAFNPARNLQDNVLNFISFVFIAMFVLGNQRSFCLFRKLLFIVANHLRVGKSQKQYYARLRNFIIPGWGNVYLKSYKTGFSLIFTYFLFLLLFFVTFFSYIDFIFGVRFLGSFGLKSTFNQKFLSEILSSVYPFIFFLALILLLYYIGHSLLKIEANKEKNSSQFFVHIHYSLLFHLVLFFLFFIVPFSIKISPPKINSVQSSSLRNLDFYIIDDQISDNLQGLNGGSILGNSEKVSSKSENFQINDKDRFLSFSQNKLGNKTYQTYSSYISAKMRGPELFMKYWKKAPENYSCVVSYVINSDGEILEAYIVEESSYPDQDKLTLSLIYSLSPLLSPPSTKGNVRVTELFWNGSIETETMPTELQKNLVLSFDGRFIEEL